MKLSAPAAFVLGLLGLCATATPTLATPSLTPAPLDQQQHHRHLSKRAPYKLITKMETQAAFLNNFYFADIPDPSGSTVEYVNKTIAWRLGMYKPGANGGFRFGADANRTGSPRKSVRLESNKKYGFGVYVFDVAHAPVGCGTWPALWSFTNSSDWPYGGEIDIYEGVNGLANSTRPNQSALHTGPNCLMPASRSMTGTSLMRDCNVANGANMNMGCAVGFSASPASYGAKLNAAGGGVFAMQHEYNGIWLWHWPRAAAPAGTKRGDNRAINVASWGKPSAAFPFGNSWCTDQHVNTNQQFVMNIAFCGGYYDSKAKADGCPADCVAYVAKNPAKFKDAYFDINSFKIYSQFY